MRTMLIGINDKNCSLRAVSWVLKQYRDLTDLDVALVHVIPNLPAKFWDDGHILSPAEDAERRTLVDSWSARQRDYIEPILLGAAYELVKAGLPADRVRTKIVTGTRDVADTLLDEARDAGVKTIVVGRCGIADGKHFLAGNTVNRLIHNATEVAVCVAH